MILSQYKILSFFIISLLLLNTGNAYGQLRSEKVEAYIAKHKDFAIEQMVLFNIPASVIMAQAIKESGSGTSNLAKESNNHFGIKCHKEWGGNYYTYNDDSLNECFRRYNSISDSYYDHSLFLKSRPRYDFLFELPVNNYFAWCTGLKNAGYATAYNYTEELILIIENYNLQELDRAITLNGSLNYNNLFVASEPNLIPSEENYFTQTEKHILAKVIFNEKAFDEEPLLVRRNDSNNRAD